MDIDAATRHQLVVLAKRKNARRAEFSPEMPTDWRPTQVRNPNALFENHFTDSTAWEFIASKIEAGHPVEPIQLDKPQGVTGYVMKIDIERGQPQLYVKLQLRSGQIVGRSFHYSEHGD